MHTSEVLLGISLMLTVVRAFPAVPNQHGEGGDDRSLMDAKVLQEDRSRRFEDSLNQLSKQDGDEIMDTLNEEPKRLMKKTSAKSWMMRVGLGKRSPGDRLNERLRQLAHIYPDEEFGMSRVVRERFPKSPFTIRDILFNHLAYPLKTYQGNVYPHDLLQKPKHYQETALISTHKKSEVPDWLLRVGLGKR